MRTWESTHSSCLDDYPLTTSIGTYTPGARLHFLKTVERLQSVSGWDESDVKLSSELAGLCSFDSAAALAEWFIPTPFRSEVIEFQGEYVCQAPDGEGAVVARFIRLQREWQDFASFRTDCGV